MREGNAVERGSMSLRASASSYRDMVAMVASYYRGCKRDLRAYECGVRNFSRSELQQYHRSIDCIDFVVSELDKESRRIMDHVLNGDPDDKNWYYEFYSDTTHRRYRDNAYAKFIDMLVF